MSKRGSGSSARAGGGGGAAAKEKELFTVGKDGVRTYTMIRRKNPEKSGCFLSIVPKL